MKTKGERTMEIVVNLKVSEATLKSLNTVYVQGFPQDDYHKTESAPSSELESRVRKIRRRYNNLLEYHKAKLDYKEYMGLLADSYPTKSLFKSAIARHEVQSFIPHKPKLKNSKKLKKMYKEGVIISNNPVSTGYFSKKDQIDPEEIDNIAAMYRSSKLPEIYIDQKVKMPKSVKEALIDLSKKSYSYEPTSDINFLDEYFKMKSKKKEDIVFGERYPVSIKDIRKSALKGDDIVDTTEEDVVAIYGGRYMTKKEIEDMKFYKELEGLGWNSRKIIQEKSGLSKSTTAIFVQESKKSKKNKKKKNKSDDRILQEIMGDNNYDDFADYMKDMEDFTSANVLGI